MPTISVSETIDAPIDQVWRVVCDVQKYPEIMDCVRAVTILAEGPDWSETRWSVDLKGSILEWVEVERRDRERYRVTYQQKEGDLERFEGFWSLERVGPNTTRAELKVDFEIGIPMLRDMLDPVAAKAITENSRRMLMSLGKPTR